MRRNFHFHFVAGAEPYEVRLAGQRGVRQDLGPVV